MGGQPSGHLLQDRPEALPAKIMRATSLHIELGALHLGCNQRHTVNDAFAWWPAGVMLSMSKIRLWLQH